MCVCVRLTMVVVVWLDGAQRGLMDWVKRYVSVGVRWCGRFDVVC